MAYGLRTAEPQAISRRNFLRSAAKVAAVGAFSSVGLASFEQPLRAAPKASAASDSALVPARPATAAGMDTPLIWVWKFSADGPLGQIQDTLARTRLGVILKTHDGTTWMEKFDDSPDAITGPAQVARLAESFERQGTPFHVWCVVKGEDPTLEARMCASVLQEGARSLFLDLEPAENGNYWQGTPEAALRFGEELRSLAPDAWITVAPDLRPWQMGAVPLPEFASFCDAIAPQSYWETFQGPTNRRRFAEFGYPTGPEGVTPELVVDVSIGTFTQFGRAIQPIGQGASPGDKWQRFAVSASERGLSSISLWRYGTADPAAFDVLSEFVPIGPDRPIDRQRSSQITPPIAMDTPQPPLEKVDSDRRVQAANELVKDRLFSFSNLLDELKDGAARLTEGAGGLLGR